MELSFSIKKYILEFTITNRVNVWKHRIAEEKTINGATLYPASEIMYW